uniref:uncharacterized protein LOC120340851 n=1 Tax=Styela clava TaxID=7725 RepID=UPI0019399460|nr:uncharacterized protein LOC120340851 [Styela clava]
MSCLLPRLQIPPNSSSFRQYYEKYRSKCSMKYPFLSPSQIRTKLLDRWRKTSSYNKRCEENRNEESDESIKQFELKQSYGAASEDVILNVKKKNVIATADLIELCTGEQIKTGNLEQVTDDIEWSSTKKSTSNPKWLTGDMTKTKVMTPPSSGKQKRHKRRKKCTSDSGISSLERETKISPNQQSTPRNRNSPKISEALVEKELCSETIEPSSNEVEEQVSFTYDKSTREFCYLFPSDVENYKQESSLEEVSTNDPKFRSFDEICAEISGCDMETTIKAVDTPALSKRLELSSKLGSVFCYQPSFEDVCAMHGIDSSIEIEDLTCDLLEESTERRVLNLQLKKHETDLVFTAGNGDIGTASKIKFEPESDFQIANYEVEQKDSKENDALQNVEKTDSDQNIEDCKITSSFTKHDKQLNDNINPSQLNEDIVADTSPKIDVSRCPRHTDATTICNIPKFSESTNDEELTNSIEESEMKIPCSQTCESQGSETSSVEITSGQPFTQSSSDCSSFSNSQTPFNSSFSTISSQLSLSVDGRRKRRKKCIEEVVTKLRCEKEKLMINSSDNLIHKNVESTSDSGPCKSVKKSKTKLDANEDQSNSPHTKQPVVQLEKLQLDRSVNQLLLGGVQFWMINKGSSYQLLDSDSTWTDVTDIDESSQNSSVQERMRLQNTGKINGSLTDVEICKNSESSYPAIDEVCIEKAEASTSSDETAQSSFICETVATEKRESDVEMHQSESPRRDLAKEKGADGSTDMTLSNVDVIKRSQIKNGMKNCVIANVVVHRDAEKLGNKAENGILAVNDCEELDEEAHSHSNGSNEDQLLCDLFDD